MTCSTARILTTHMAVIRFLSDLTLYSTVIVPYQTERGLNFTEIFWLESILSAAIFLFEVPTGVLADRLGYRRTIILGQSCFAASYIMFALAYGFLPFALSSLLFGLGIACNSGCDSALLYESLPSDQRQSLSTTAFSLVSAAASGGLFCGLAQGSWLGSKDPAVPVVVNIIPMVLALVASLFLRPVGAWWVVRTRPATRR